MLHFEERNDGAGNLRIRVHPLECRLGISVRIVEVFKISMPRTLQGLHGHYAHILFIRRAVHDLTELRPDAVMVGEHHHVETSGGDRLVRNNLKPRRMRRDAQETRLPLRFQDIERFMNVRIH